MNLIEQLGGYLQAKALMVLPAATYDCGVRFSREELECAMLDHRRHHNIFEVLDLIMYENKLYEIKYIYHPEKARITDGFQGRTVYDFPSGIRHATDEEIKAGRRL